MFVSLRKLHWYKYIENIRTLGVFAAVHRQSCGLSNCMSLLKRIKFTLICVVGSLRHCKEYILQFLFLCILLDNDGTLMSFTTKCMYHEFPLWWLLQFSILTVNVCEKKHHEPQELCENF